MTTLKSDDSYELSKQILFALISSPYCQEIIDGSHPDLDSLVRNLLITRETIEKSISDFEKDNKKPMNMNPKIVSQAASRSKQRR